MTFFKDNEVKKMMNMPPQECILITYINIIPFPFNPSEGLCQNPSRLCYTGDGEMNINIFTWSIKVKIWKFSCRVRSSLEVKFGDQMVLSKIF